MAQNSGNIDQIVEQIVCTVLLGDKDYQNIEDKAKRKMIYDQQTESVNESINQMCAQIESNLPKGMSLPSGIRVEVASQLLMEVGHNPSAAINGFELDTKQIMKDFNLPVREHINESRSEIDSAMGVATAGVLISAMAKEYGSGSEQEAQIINRAYSPNATAHDHDMYVALSQIEVACFEQKVGITPSNMSEFDKGIKVKTVKTLIEEGKLDKAKIIMNQYGLTEEDINSGQYNHVVFEDNTTDKNDAFISARIQRFSEKVESFAKNYGEMTPNERKEAFDILDGEYNQSNEKIDIGFDSLARIAMQTDKITAPEMAQLTKRLISDLRNPEQKLQIDEYVTANMVMLVSKLSKTDPETAKQLLDGFNARAREINYSQLKFEDIAKLTESDLNILLCNQGSEKQITGKEGYDKLVEAVQQGKILPKSNSTQTLQLDEDTNMKSPKVSKTTNKSPVDSMRSTLNGVHERRGMQGVMKCMSVRCLDENIPKNQRQMWLSAFSSFLDMKTNSPLGSTLKVEDSEEITQMVKKLVESRGTSLADDKIAYGFVQIAEKAKKTSVRQEKNPVLSADKITTKQIIEHFDNGKNKITKDSNSFESQDEGKNLDSEEGPEL